jgi:hypothetical protein
MPAGRHPHMTEEAMSAVKRAIVSGAILLVFSGWARPAQAASIPFIDVRAFGVELCPQSFCGAAIFVGLLQGQVGFNPYALGTFAVAIRHGDLPELSGGLTSIDGGAFDFRFGLRSIRGIVLPDGVLRNNGNDTFSVRAVLFITDGGWGTLKAEVLLDHRVFPPTVIATVESQ